MSTPQLREFVKHALYPWQASVLDMVRNPDTSKIHVIVSHFMGEGKSVFIRWLESKELARELPSLLPSLTTSEGMMAVVNGAPECGAYCVEAPCFVSEAAWEDFCHGLRAVQEHSPSRPAIFVFTMSTDEFLDAWGDASTLSIWSITADKKLQPAP